MPASGRSATLDRRRSSTGLRLRLPFARRSLDPGRKRLAGLLGNLELDRTLALLATGEASGSCARSEAASANRTLPVARPYAVARIAHPRAC